MKIVLSIFLAAILSIASWYHGAWIQHKADDEQLNSFKERMTKLTVEAMKNTISLEEANQIADYMKSHAKDHLK